MKKYNKKVLYHYVDTIDTNELALYILDDDEYYNIHLIDPNFREDESNTLKLQEPKSSIKLEDICNPAYCISRLYEHHIWFKYYELGIANCSISLEFEAHSNV